VLWLPPVVRDCLGYPTPMRNPGGGITAVLSAFVAAMVRGSLVRLGRTAKTQRSCLSSLHTQTVAGSAGEFHSKPIWYFVPVLFVAGHPWSFSPFVRQNSCSDAIEICSQSVARRDRVSVAVECVGGFSFSFRCPKCKLPTYLLPAGTGTSH